MLMRQCLITLLRPQKHIHILFNAENKDEVLSYLKYKQPDILVLSMDKYMPDAFNLLQALKSFPQTRSIALIEEESDSLVLDLLEQDVKAILGKTTDIQTLIQVIGEVHSKGFYYTQEVTKIIGRRMGRLTLYPADYGITPRENEILYMVCQGKSSREIAKQLFISIKTVERHRYNLFKKTGSKNRVELIQWTESTES